MDLAVAAEVLHALSSDLNEVADTPGREGLASELRVRYLATLGLTNGGFDLWRRKRAADGRVIELHWLDV